MTPLETLEDAVDRLADLIEDNTYGVIQGDTYILDNKAYRITLEEL